MSARRRSPSSAHPALVVVLLMLLSTVSACATIPDSGPVVSGRLVDSDPREGLVQFGGESPGLGDSPVDIVAGFLRNAAGFGDDHQQARSFLTSTRRLTWQPEYSVKIYPSQYSLKIREVVPKPVKKPTPAPTASTTTRTRAAVEDGEETVKVEVTTAITAKIDGFGRYTAAKPGETTTAKFVLVRTGSEWRIKALADGILIVENDFGVTFRPFPVYFGDPTGRFLVPDLHWLPGTQDESRAPELPTALVRALLKGPPEWLSGAVISGAPDRTGMAVAAVVVDQDVATVDLTEQVKMANAWHRQLLVSQLQATLAPLRISSVQITVRRVALDVPSGAVGTGGESDPSQPTVRPVVDPRVDNRPVLIDKKGRLARLANSKLELVRDVDALSGSGVNRPAVSSDSSTYAALNADRSRLLLQLPGAKVVRPVRAKALTAPSFDPQGWAWTAPGAGGEFVYAAGADAETGAVKVTAPWLKGLDVVSMRLSRDGTRAAFVVRSQGVAHLFLAGVVRDALGRPLSLNQPIGLFPDLKTVKDVAWVEEDQVVVLGHRTGFAGTRPWVVQIGGTVQSGGETDTEPESITAGNGAASLIAGTGKGIEVRSGALWDTVAAGRWPAFPG